MNPLLLIPAFILGGAAFVALDRAHHRLAYQPEMKRPPLPTAPPEPPLPGRTVLVSGREIYPGGPIHLP